MLSERKARWKFCCITIRHRSVVVRSDRPVMFAIWRVIEAAFDVDRHGNDGKGLVRRAAMLGGAVANLALSFLALGIVFGVRAVPMRTPSPEIGPPGFSQGRLGNGW